MKAAFNILLCLTFVSLISCELTTRATQGIKSCYQKAKFTQYWIPKEGSKDMLNDGKVVVLNGPKRYSLKTASGKVIAKVSKTSYKKFQMEGTGLLKSGELINIGLNDKEFAVVDQKIHPYGIGSNDNSIYPFTSVASNDLKLGTKLYVKAIDGLQMPTGKKHNGCLRVDDSGDSFSGCQLDFFVLDYNNYGKIATKLPETVHVIAKDCELLNYTDATIDAWSYQP
ncbi:hypothetical protein NQZ79_g1102 [Umbelopsis isabellina]|nr:hypothetical protein NQZ79_g1102 [Umbelopsis isabellina]